MGQIGNPGATAPKLSNERIRAIIGDPGSNPETARLAQEVIDRRACETMLGAADELSDELAAALDANVAHLDTITSLRAELDQVKALLEQRNTELHDIQKRGAA